MEKAENTTTGSQQFYHHNDHRSVSMPSCPWQPCVAARVLAAQPCAPFHRLLQVVPSLPSDRYRNVPARTAPNAESWGHCTFNRR